MKTEIQLKAAISILEECAKTENSLRISGMLLALKWDLKPEPDEAPPLKPEEPDARP